jgi:hypothetical protein
MASTYSTDLKIELMVTGENAGTWGDKTNDNLNVIQQAIAGYGTQSIAGGAQTTALTIANSPTLSVARNIVIKLVGTITGNQIVTVPDGIEKTWIVSNGTTGSFTVQFKTVSGTGATWTADDKGIKILYSDGTDVNTVDLSTLSGTVASASIANLAVTSAKLASFAVTEARLASFAVTTSRLATNAVTGVKITQSTITQSKLAANSVGSNQLISTGVTAASYTAASITVDADGRITAASSGSAGAGAFVPKITSVGPASGTLTSNATRLLAYATSGGGGGGGGFGNNPGGTGGSGRFALFSTPISPPFSQPYAIGAGGNGGAGSNNNTSGNGNAGGTTSVGTFFSINAGTGGNGVPAPGSNSGNPGSAGNVGSGTPLYSTTATNDKIYVFQNTGVGGPSNTNAAPGTAGTPGSLFLFDNSGT